MADDDKKKDDGGGGILGDIASVLGGGAELIAHGAKDVVNPQDVMALVSPGGMPFLSQVIGQNAEEIEKKYGPDAVDALRKAGVLGKEKDAKVEDPKKKDKESTPNAPAQTPAEIEKEIAANPFNKLGEGVVKQLQQEQAPIEKAISGGDTASSAKSAESQAFAAAGVSPTSSAGEWLNSNIQKAQAADQPMQQAMEAYGKAYSAGQTGVDQALLNSGQANALGVTTAPEQTWLQDMAQHIQSNLSYYGQIPTAAAKNLPPALLYYLQQSGTGGAGGPGVTQLSNLSVPGQPAPKSIQGTNLAPNVTTSVSGDSGAAPS